MKRRSLTILLSAVAVLGGFAGAYLIQPSASGTKTPTLNEVLNLPRAPSLTERLYAGTTERDLKTGQLLEPLDRSVDLVLGGQTSSINRYSKSKDRSTEDSLLLDGDHKWFSQSYFPTSDDAPLAGRHPHVKRIFAPDKFTLVDEEVRRYNGTKEQTSHFDLDGKGKHIVEYAGDGETVLAERSFDLSDTWLGPAIKSEKRWRLDKNQKRTLAYSNTRHEDHSRTITFLDEQELPLRIEEWSKYGGVSGTTIKGFYPGTTKVRFETSSDSYVDTAKYYLPSGSLSHILMIRSTNTSVDYFDSNGKKLPFEQNWHRSDKTENGLTTSTYNIYLLLENDAQGNMTRHTGFDSDALVERDEYYNRTIDGITYKEIDYIYDHSPTLKKAQYWKDTLKYPPDKEEDHTPAENIRPEFAANELTLNVAIEDNLPIPPPVFPMGHR
jgi:hypothetical protein